MSDMNLLKQHPNSKSRQIRLKLSPFDAMLKERRAWAEEQGLSSDLIEKIYRDLVTWFISEEMKHWEETQSDLT